MIFAHIAGIPVEEMLAMAPAAIGACVMAGAGLRSRIRHLRH